MRNPNLQRPSADQLRVWYIDERKGCPDIAAMIGCDPSTVRLWLVEHGIPTRPRGSNTILHFGKGMPSAFKGRKHSAQSLARIRQTSIDRGAVPYLRNGQHWLKTASPEQNPKWRGGITPERQTFYRSEGWRAACVAVWKRDNAKCRRCALDFRTVLRGTIPFHVHHIDSFAIVERRAVPDNLALLCEGCHKWVHSRKNRKREFLGEGHPTLKVAGGRKSKVRLPMTAAPNLFDLMPAGEVA